MAYPQIETLLKYSSATGRYSLILLLVVLVPNALLLSGVFQLFPPVGWVDPGIYTGYFWKLPQLIHRFGASYFSMRLPFTGVGFIIHNVFPPETATKAVAVFFNSLAALSLFFLVSKRTNIIAGVVAAWGLTLSPLWIATISRTYVDGPAMAYALTALAIIVAPKDESLSKAKLVAGGMVAALAVYTHPMTIFLLALAFAANAFVVRPKIKSILTEAGWIVVGTIATTVLLGFASRLLGGNFLFFLADRYVFTQPFSGFGVNWRYALSNWVPGAYRLLPVAALLALGGGLLIVLKRTHAAYGLVAMGFAVAAGITTFFIILDFVIGGSTLQSSFYSSYLIAGLAIIVGALASMAFEQSNVRLSYLAVVGIGLVAIAIAVFGNVEPMWKWADHHIRIVWIILTTGFIAASAFFINEIRFRSSGPLLLQFLPGKKAGFVLLVVTIAACGIFNKDTRRIFITPSGVDYLTSYRSTMEVADFVNQFIRVNERILFWYDRDELTRAVQPHNFYNVYELRFGERRFFLNYWDSLTAVWLWDRSSLGWTLPVLQPDELKKLISFDVPTIIGALCVDVKKCESTSTVISGHGYRVTEAGRKHINDTGYTAFWIIIYKVNRTTPG